VRAVGFLRVARRAAHLLLGGVAIAVVAVVADAAAPAAGQGTVRGRVTLVERSGARGADVREAVLYLEPTSRLASFASDDGAVLDSSTIAMHRREFVPRVRVVRVGGRVAFPNDDPFSHNVFSNSTLGPFDLGLYRAGASRTARFPRPGAYAIYCNIHHRMVSYVVAVPTGLATRPEADGRFTIDGVPAGTYVLHAWHERAGATSQTVVVGGVGADVAVALDARDYMPAPHLNKFGLPYSATRADRY